MLEWITAVGTLLAALVPFVLFLLERSDRKSAEAERDAAERKREAANEKYRTAELERLRVREASERESQERAQAKSVHIWYGIENEELKFYAINTSASPVSDVTIDAMVYFTSPKSPHDPEAKHLLLGIIHLPPTGQTPFIYRLEDLLLFTDYDTPDPEAHTAGVVGIRSFSFIDSQGLKWRREVTGWTSGTLSRLEHT